MLDEENYDCCVELANLLGQYLQYMTQGHQTTAPLVDELRHAQAYAEIQKVRFSDRVDFFVSPLPKGWEGVKVPRLILQPLLENAFEHGVKNRSTTGIIGIRFIETDDSLTLIVENDGDGLSEEALALIEKHATVEPTDAQGVALFNISSRLKLMGMVPDGLSFAVSPLGGLAVSFTLHRT